MKKKVLDYHKMSILRQQMFSHVRLVDLMTFQHLLGHSFLESVSLLSILSVGAKNTPITSPCKNVDMSQKEPPVCCEWQHDGWGVCDSSA